jgi:23S rRNA (adenine2030-N6)-methyltransferase
MNYRHAYHAGNHTEVFKHAVLVLLLQHLLQKHQPFMVLDTHAGAGIYDLTTMRRKRPARRWTVSGASWTKKFLRQPPIWTLFDV